MDIAYLLNQSSGSARTSCSVRADENDAHRVWIYHSIFSRSVLTSEHDARYEHSGVEVQTFQRGKGSVAGRELGLAMYKDCFHHDESYIDEHTDGSAARFVEESCAYFRGSSELSAKSGRSLQCGLVCTVH